MDPLKETLTKYLQQVREDLLWKLEGLTEHEARQPLTGTGTSLAGIVKHCLNVEVGYFGPTFGREFPTPHELVPFEVYDTDPQADWYLTEDESVPQMVDLYRRVWVFCDETVDMLELDAPGRVPWWPEGRADVTLGRILVHVTTELHRHAGHADILREQLDDRVGIHAHFSNLPGDGYDWPAYLDKLRALADR